VVAVVQGVLALAQYQLTLIIFIAEVINADTSVMFEGTTSVVFALAATRE